MLCSFLPPKRVRDCARTIGSSTSTFFQLLHGHGRGVKALHQQFAGASSAQPPSQILRGFWQRRPPCWSRALLLPMQFIQSRLSRAVSCSRYVLLQFFIFFLNLEVCIALTDCARMLINTVTSPLIDIFTHWSLKVTLAGMEVFLWRVNYLMSAWSDVQMHDIWHPEFPLS